MKLKFNIKKIYLHFAREIPSFFILFVYSYIHLKNLVFKEGVIKIFHKKLLTKFIQSYIMPLDKKRSEIEYEIK